MFTLFNELYSLKTSHISYNVREETPYKENTASCFQNVSNFLLKPACFSSALTNIYQNVLYSSTSLSVIWVTYSSG